jgi:hypothetical protein
VFFVTNTPYDGTSASPLELTMLQTILIGSCISVQGLLVKQLANGRMLVRVGERLYEGRPANAAPQVA